MINWNEVKVGETELVKDNLKRLVAGVFPDEVCLRYGDMTHGIFWKDSLHDWTIYDPWEDVSEECSINEWGRVEHKGEIIDFKPNVYKRSEKGLRVWKRKENQS